MTVLVFLDPAFPHGRVVDACAPQLLATDPGLGRGDGVFETLLAVDQVPRKLPAHLARLARSAAALQLDIPDRQSWGRAINTAVAEHPAVEELTIKLMAVRGAAGIPAACWVTASPAPESVQRQRTGGIRVLLLDRGYDSTVADRAPWLLLGAKTLSYAVNMAALRYAHEHGADDVIFTSSDGKVLEGPTSTVILASVQNGRKKLSTPLLESGILPGTTQGSLFAAAARSGWELGYGPLEPDDLFAADALWLVSSVRLMAPVTSIDGAALPTSAALTAELMALLAEDLPAEDLPADRLS